MFNFKFLISNFKWLGLLLFCATIHAQETWQKAVGPRLWSFPRDHGAHPDFRTEWWYFTGNLKTPEGREFGYQLTFFRHGVQFTPAQKSSAFALRDVHFAHFTITDVASEKFHAAERVDRGALDLSGCSEEEMNVWLDDWTLETIGNEKYRLVAKDGAQSIDLILAPAKPLVLEGDRGLSQKAIGEGNASYYYSYPRLLTTGHLRVNGNEFEVSGASWFDKEFSTSSLGPQQVGWDWLSIQLDNQEELMLYQLRNQDGQPDKTSSGTFVGIDGKPVPVKNGEFQIEVLRKWKSPKTGATYPAQWRVRLPNQKLDLIVEPKIADQELVLSGLKSMSYWEGACRVHGTRDGREITGAGYTELTGYSGAIADGLK